MSGDSQQSLLGLGSRGHKSAVGPGKGWGAVGGCERRGGGGGGGGGGGAGGGGGGGGLGTHVCEGLAQGLAYS